MGVPFSHRHNALGLKGSIVAPVRLGPITPQEGLCAPTRPRVRPHPRGVKPLLPLPEATVAPQNPSTCSGASLTLNRSSYGVTRFHSVRVPANRPRTGIIIIEAPKSPAMTVITGP